MRIAKAFIPLLGVFLWFGTAPLRAQEEETPEQKQYREDYEAYQKIQAVQDPLKRAEELLKFLKERPKSKILPNVQTDYLYMIQGQVKQSKWETVLAQANHFIDIRPKVGEAYFFKAQALNEMKEYEGAIDALARCYILKNPASEKAKQFLDTVYKRTHKGSLDGLNQLIQKIRKEISG
jgi:hypothetical protein